MRWDDYYNKDRLGKVGDFKIEDYDDTYYIVKYKVNFVPLNRHRGFKAAHINQHFFLSKYDVAVHGRDEIIRLIHAGLQPLVVFDYRSAIVNEAGQLRFDELDPLLKALAQTHNHLLVVSQHDLTQAQSVFPIANTPIRCYHDMPVHQSIREYFDEWMQHTDIINGVLEIPYQRDIFIACPRVIYVGQRPATEIKPMSVFTQIEIDEVSNGYCHRLKQQFNLSCDISHTTLQRATCSFKEPATYQELWNKYHDPALASFALLADYCKRQANSKWDHFHLFISGHWRRHHVNLVNRVLNQFDLTRCFQRGEAIKEFSTRHLLLSLKAAIGDRHMNYAGSLVRRIAFIEKQTGCFVFDLKHYQPRVKTVADSAPHRAEATFMHSIH